MELATLKLIIEQALQANGRHVLGEHTPALILDNKLVSIEHLQEGRSRFRGSMSTTVLSEFIGYVKRHTGGEVFIDPKKPNATAFLNLGTKDKPGHADWKASLALAPTAAFAALLAIEGKPLPQRDLVEWIEDWVSFLSARRDGAEISITEAVTAIREVTIETSKQTTNTDRDFGASKSSLEQIEARAKGGMPTHLLFRVTPYLGLQTRDFVLRISVMSQAAPALALRIVGKEQAEEDIAQEFKTVLQTAIDADANLTIGSFAP